MDKTKYLELLSQVAEWRIPPLSDTDVKESQRRQRGRGRPSQEELDQILHEQQFLDLHNGCNPTMAEELVSVKIQSVNCEDCGELCAQGRRLDIRLFPAQRNAIAHRRSRCMECGLYQHPETGAYTMPQRLAAGTYLGWAKRQFLLRKKPDKTQTDK